MAAAGVIAIGLALSATASAGEKPVLQYSDRLETSSHELLVGLYATQLEGGVFEFEWVLEKLPCATKAYKFFATGAAIDSSQSGSAEAGVHMLSATMPRGVRCGSRLPFGSGQGVTEITIVPQPQPAEAGMPPIAYDGNQIKIDSSIPCVRLTEICDGRYLLIVNLAALHRRLHFEYVFRVVDATSGKDPSRHTRSDARFRVRQCPIR